MTGAAQSILLVFGLVTLFVILPVIASMIYPWWAIFRRPIAYRFPALVALVWSLGVFFLSGPLFMLTSWGLGNLLTAFGINEMYGLIWMASFGPLLLLATVYSIRNGVNISFLAKEIPADEE